MTISRQRTSYKATQFTESVIREMTRLAVQHNAINLAQGFPNFPAPENIKKAACRAIHNDINQYAITWGSPRFRRAIAKRYQQSYGWKLDPEKEITVACGATECMIASILAVVNPGERIVIFEPFYENYVPDCIIAGASPLFVSLDPEHNWVFNTHSLQQQIEATGAEEIRALILNSPNNPSGKVFSSEELSEISRLAQEYDFYVITDEIYEHITYDGKLHHPIALLPGMKERTITISGLSKTFSVTGWRIGYILAPEDLTSAIRKMHDFLTVGAAAPLQEAGLEAMKMGPSYYRELAATYAQRRDFLLGALTEVGFKVWKPSGAYYIMADISPVTKLGDVEFVHHLITHCGVAAVPGTSFYHTAVQGRQLIRFTFCKSLDILREARERLRRLSTDLG